MVFQITEYKTAKFNFIYFNIKYYYNKFKIFYSTTSTFNTYINIIKTCI